MGISRGAIHLLAMNLADKVKRDRVVTFGVQKIVADHDEIRHILGAHGYPPSTMTSTSRQTVLFQSLGFRSIDSIDYYPDEGPTITCDLNRPLPPKLQAAFDLVYDGGTMEHCFDPAQLLRNAASLVAPEGLVIHHVPLNNWVDHGFYQFSPTLFFDFYHAAGFTDLNLKIHFMKGSRESYVEYDPGRHQGIPYALGGRQRVLAFFSARCNADAASRSFPSSIIQGRYRSTFGDRTAETPRRRKSMLQRLQNSLNKRLFEWKATRL